MLVSWIRMVWHCFVFQVKPKKKLINAFERAFTTPKCLDIDKTIAIKEGFKCFSL
jgi:hypothetical protein